MSNIPYTIEASDGESSPRWPEFVACLKEIAPVQAPFVLGEYSRDLPCCLLLAVQNDRVAGFLRFGVQPIGPEAGCAPLVLNGVPLTEAKIHAFAVRETARCQGIGTDLQRRAIQWARGLGCHQVASHSRYGNDANYHVKLSLGFSAQPEVHGEPGNRQAGTYFLMPLRAG